MPKRGIICTTEIKNTAVAFRIFNFLYQRKVARFFYESSYNDYSFKKSSYGKAGRTCKCFK